MSVLNFKGNRWAIDPIDYLCAQFRRKKLVKYDLRIISKCLKDEKSKTLD